MEMAALEVRMLGRFSITRGGREVGDGDNRSRKAWEILAYMIYFRGQTIPQEELLARFWGKNGKSVRPVNALKTMFHRIRTMLDALGPNAGRELVIRRNGAYAWNSYLPLRVDVDDFAALCKSAETGENEDKRLEEYRRALDLYAGDFLPKLSEESWVVPINACLHGYFVKVCRETVALLEKRGMTDEVIALCRRAVEIEPSEDDFYCHLMKGLIARGERREATGVYRGMRDLLFSNFGVMPSDEAASLYREAVRPLNDREISIDIIRKQLRETKPDSGALVCDYDMFKGVYRMLARSVMRSGDAVHLALLSVSGEKGTLSRRSREICMGNLLGLIRQNLRRGDVVARCSLSQYIVLLQQADYENSCGIMERINRSFARHYPHSPAQLIYAVQPIEPCQ